MVARGWNRTLLHSFALFLASSAICNAILVNRTIDDSDVGDPTSGFIPVYNPQIWNRNGAPCVGCTINPDPLLAFDGTMSSTTYIPASLQKTDPKYNTLNITLRFTGVSIWVFFILANANANNPFTSTHCNFTLDGQFAGTFSHEPDMSTTALQYNSTVFSQTGLSNTPHQLVISISDYPNITYINFDWAMYTADVDASSISSPTTSAPATSISSNPSASSSAVASQSSGTSSNNTPAIVGGVLGGLALLLVVVLALLWWRRWRKKPTTEVVPPEPQAFMNVSPQRGPGSTGGTSFSAPEKARSVDGNDSQWPNQSGTFHPNRPMPLFSPGVNEAATASTSDMTVLHNQVDALRSRIEQLHERLPPDFDSGMSEGEPPAYAYA